MAILQITNPLEASLTLFYFDEALGDWLPLPTQVDSTTQTLTAASDHLTVFDFQCGGGRVEVDDPAMRFSR